MLDHVKLREKLHTVAADIFAQDTYGRDVVHAAWQALCADPAFLDRIITTAAPWPTPLWQGNIDAVWDHLAESLLAPWFLAIPLRAEVAAISLPIDGVEPSVDGVL